MECRAKELKAAYQREWRRKNPGKSTEYTRRYWQRKAQQELLHKEGGGNNG